MRYSFSAVAVSTVVLYGSTVRGQEPVRFIHRSEVSVARALPANVIREQRVDVDQAVLRTVSQSQILQLDLFADVSFSARRQRVEPTAHGTAWIGVLDGYRESTATFVLAGNELVGHIYSPFGFFSVGRSPDGGYVVEQIDERTQSGARDDVEPVPASLSTAAPRGTLRPLRDTGGVVDVMVLYTPNALAGWQTEVRANAVIDAFIADTNQAFRNSAVTSSVRLVYAGVVSYVESGDSLTDARRLQSPTDGFLDDAYALRDEYAADVVTLITETFESNTCGRAYVNTPRSTGATGFGVVKRSCTATARSYAHELGHNLGLEHDWYVTTSGGAFNYSKGYASIAGRFVDLMAYFDLCVAKRISCAQLLQYANPRLDYRGIVTGVAPGTNVTCTVGNLDNPDCDADGAATINQMAPVVAAFKDSRTAANARRLKPGGSLRSPNGRYRLTFQADGNLVLYDDEVPSAIWSTGTAGIAPGQALLQADGNFVVYDAANIAAWSTGTAGKGGAYLGVQDDGNLVIYSLADVPVWTR